MANTEKRTSTIILDGRQPAKTLRELSGDIRILGNHMKKLDMNSDSFKTAGGKMRELKQTMGDTNQQMRNTSTAWGRMWKSIKVTAAGVLMGNLLTSLTTMLGSVIPELIKRNADLSDSYADIRKTTGLTNDEVKDLDKTMSKFNTRTAKKELRELAVEAGRLGVEGVAQIAGFVRAADKIKVALGDDLGSDAAANIRVIGKLAEQFRVAERTGSDLETSMLKTGSAINELSASGSTQADFLINFTKRTSGVTNSADIAIESVLGLAATLDESGQNVEVSATTINKVLVKMFTDTETYANIAGVGVGEFTTLLNSDANAALVLFLEGLNGNSEGLTQLATKLEDAELEGARATAVLAALAANTDKLAEKQQISNKALAEGTSLTNEFNIKNNNLAGTVDKIGKKMASLWLNSTLRDGVSAMVELFGDLLGINTKVSQQLESQRIDLMVLERQIVRTNLGSEERVTLLTQLKEQYPEYLAHLDAEKASNEDVKIAVDALNESLLDRIVLQLQDEAVLENKTKLAEATRELMLLDAKYERNLLKRADSMGIVLDKTKSLTEMTKQLKDEADATGGYQRGMKATSGLLSAQEIRNRNVARGDISEYSAKDSELTTDRDAIAKSIGIDKKSDLPEKKVDKPKDKPTKTPIDPDAVVVAAAKTKLIYADFLTEMTQIEEAFRISQLEQAEMEEAQIDQKYDKQLEKLQEYLINKQITEDEWQLQVDEINALRQEEKDVLEKEREEEKLLKETEFRNKLGDMALNEQDRDVAQTNRKYDELLTMAEEYGVDAAEVEKLREMELAEIREHFRTVDLEKETKFRAEMGNIYRGFGNALMDVMGAMGEEQSSWAEFSRGIAFFQLAMSQAQAIANALQTTTSPSADNIATGGLAGIAKFATISTAILTTIAGGKRLVSGQNTPSYSGGNRFERGGFYTGGPTHGQGGSAIIDGYSGAKTGEVEGGEAIFSRAFTANNYAMVDQMMRHSNATSGGRIPQFDFENMNVAASGMASGGGGVSLDAQLFDAAVKQFSMAIQQIDARVVFTQEMVRDLRVNMGKQERMENRKY